jgi:hypothetical protein
MVDPQRASQIADAFDEIAQKWAIEGVFQREADNYALTQAPWTRGLGTPQRTNAYRQALVHFFNTRTPEFLSDEDSLDTTHANARPIRGD